MIGIAHDRLFIRIMKFKDFDIFPKLQSDFDGQTASGGFITISTIALALYLFLSSTFSFFSTPPKQRLMVDETPLPTVGDKILDFANLPKMNITFDITLHSLPCHFVDFNIIDSFKEIHPDAFAKVKLRRLDKNGKEIPKRKSPVVQVQVCGSCYGMASGCCNTCKDVKNAFKAKGRVPPPLSTISQCKDSIPDYETIKNEQCKVFGMISVPPVKGIFYISPGDSYGARTAHVADYQAYNLTIDDFNLTHTINRFYIGRYDPGNAPLNQIHVEQKEKGRMKTLYFIRSTRENLGDVDFYRLGVSHYERYREGSSGKFPIISFYYNVSPLIVEYKRDVSILHFLVDIMAIVGGIFAIGRFLDYITTSSGNQLKKAAREII